MKKEKHEYVENSRMRFDTIREMAINAGIMDNVTVIGLWAKSQGFIRKQGRDKNRKTYYYYVKED